jgi:hypothetical protein
VESDAQKWLHPGAEPAFQCASRSLVRKTSGGHASHDKKKAAGTGRGGLELRNPD